MREDTARPFFSIIVPIYNCEKYLHYCIDSVLGQTFASFEIILINDGSTDKSGEICEKYMSTDSRVRVYHSSNRGVSHARNIGLEVVQGEYVCFVDADDTIDSEFLSNVYNVLLNEKYSLVITGFEYVYEGDNRKSEIYSLDNHRGEGEALDFVEGIFNPDGYRGFLCNKVFEKSIIKNNSIKLNDSISICEDMLFCLEYSEYVKKIYVINIPLYYYLQHKESAIHKLSRIRVMGEEFVADYILDKYRDCSFGNIKKYVNSKACTYYLDCIYKADFKNNVYDKDKIKKLLRKIESISNIDGDRSNFMQYYMLKHFPKLAFYLYRLLRFVSGKSIA